MRARKIWYSVSCLFSVQYRNWESEQRTFKVGFDAISPKGQRVCDQRTELWTHRDCGGVESPHLPNHTEHSRRRLLSCVRPSLEIRFCGSVRYRGRKSRRKSGSPLTWNENNVKEPKKKNTTKQALETTRSSLSLSYLDLFRKIEPTRQRHRLKTTAVRLCSAKTRRAWATNLSVCVFYDFFFLLNCAHVWLVVLIIFLQVSSFTLRVVRCTV